MRDEVGIGKGDCIIKVQSWRSVDLLGVGCKKKKEVPARCSRCNPSTLKNHFRRKKRNQRRGGGKLFGPPNS